MKRQRFITTVKSVTEKKKKFKSLIRFHSAHKIDNCNRGAKRRGKKEKKSKRIYKTSQNTRKINVFLESLLKSSFPCWESQSTSPP